MVLSGELNRTVGIEVWTFTQDDAGGAIPELADSWEQKAKVLKRSGSQVNNNSQQQWVADLVVFVRNLKTIRLNYTLIYEGDRYTINDVKVLDEGDKRFYQIAASKVQTWQAGSS